MPTSLGHTWHAPSHRVLLGDTWQVHAFARELLAHTAGPQPLVTEQPLWRPRRRGAQGRPPSANQATRRPPYAPSFGRAAVVGPQLARAAAEDIRQLLRPHNRPLFKLDARVRIPLRPHGLGECTRPTAAPLSAVAPRARARGDLPTKGLSRRAPVWDHLAASIWPFHLVVPLRTHPRLCRHDRHADCTHDAAYGARCLHTARGTDAQARPWPRRPQPPWPRA